MNDSDPKSFEERLAGELRSAGRIFEPSATLEHRVGDRLRARLRRRRAVQAASACALMAIVGLAAVVATNDRSSRIATSDRSTVDSVIDATDDTTASPSVAPPVSDDAFAEVSAVNVLVVGTDNGACLEPGSPYADAFGDRSAIGERTDTIMVVRIDPAVASVSVLSFPRDLWVTIDGRNGKGRLNSAFQRDAPQALINTLYSNFGIGVDHFVQIDFCAFTTIVDAIGGVAVPFERPVRDVHSGLSVAEPGCRTLDGDEALAYVRSRHFETLDASGTWVPDRTSDLGRIARQQHLLQRTMMAVFETGLGDPAVIGDLIGAAQEFVVVDSGLTISRMMELAGALRSADPAEMGRYQIEAVGDTVAGNAVLIPTLDSESMRAILELFGAERLDPPPSASASSSAASVPGVPAAPPDNVVDVTPVAQCP